ncbi:hypothetical protein [Spirulina subsalsa]|uniref:hypothetical protein n=1 Tax=Spirulina subsalsa TaxID=54311 RepID=UPI00047467EF|nr:hypothetical protein [Spirulina subsalsa]
MSRIIKAEKTHLVVKSEDIMILEGTLLAQTINDPDVLGQIQRAAQNFIESGQVWALIIGFIIGYGFKGMMPG